MPDNFASPSSDPPVSPETAWKPPGLLGYSVWVIRRHPVPKHPVPYALAPGKRGGRHRLYLKMQSPPWIKNLCSSSVAWGLSLLQGLQQMGSCPGGCGCLSPVFRGTATASPIPSSWSPEKAPGAPAVLLGSQGRGPVPPASLGVEMHTQSQERCQATLPDLVV